MSFEYFGGHCPPNIQLILGGIIMKNNIGIYKSHPKSFIKKIDLASSVADELFCEKPSMDDKEVLVLQVANFGEGIVLAEIIYRSDYDENYNIENHTIEIHKSHNKSIMKCFHITSPFAGDIFAMKPTMNSEEVVVLQVVNFKNDGMLIAEVVYKSDYEESE